MAYKLNSVTLTLREINFRELMDLEFLVFFGDFVQFFKPEVYHNVLQ